MVFGSYNNKIENPRTPYDWLTRDESVVDAYIAHPLCGFTASCGLLRDMMKGIYYIEQKKNLQNMKKHQGLRFRRMQILINKKFHIPTTHHC